MSRQVVLPVKCLKTDSSHHPASDSGTAGLFNGFHPRDGVNISLPPQQTTLMTCNLKRGKRPMRKRGVGEAGIPQRLVLLRCHLVTCSFVPELESGPIYRIMSRVYIEHLSFIRRARGSGTMQAKPKWFSLGGLGSEAWPLEINSALKRHLGLLCLCCNSRAGAIR